MCSRTSHIQSWAAGRGGGKFAYMEEEGERPAASEVRWLLCSLSLPPASSTFSLRLKLSDFFCDVILHFFF